MSESEAASTSASQLAASGDILEKLNTAKRFKEDGDKAFQASDVKTALREYHQAILYLRGLDKNALQKALGQPIPPPPPIEAVDQAAQEKPRTEIDVLLEKIYSNMSQCHVTNSNWERVIETANGALAINPKNRKALFRKAKAYGETGWFEKAETILQDLIKDAVSPEKEACEAELQRLSAMDREREKTHNKKMKGFLNKGRINLGED